jgi:catecholate siderophore receptor
MHVRSNSRRHRRAAPGAGPRSTPAPRPAAPPLASLGALAAGFGLSLLPALSAAQGAAPPPPRAASAPAEATLPTVRARAATAPEEKGKDALQTNTTTIGKGSQEIRDVPQSLTVVTEKLLDDAKLDSLRQALHYTAGISFAATENGTDQDIRLRGFPVATTGDLLIDGMKDPSQYDRDTFNLDRIEVLRGSASMLFGRGSTGGVINQVTKKPSRLASSELVTTVGTGSYLRSTGDFNVPLGENAAVRLNAMFNTADNHGANIDKHGLAASVGWGLGTRDEFTLGGFWLEVDNRPPSSIRYLQGSVASAIPPKNYYGTDSDYLRGEAGYVSGSWLHELGGGGTVRTQFRTGVSKRDAWYTVAGFCGAPLNAAGACPAGSPAVTSIDGNTPLTRTGLAPRRDRLNGTYVQSDFSKRLEFAGMRHELLAGVDFADESANRYGAFGTVGTNYNKGGTTVGTPDDGRVLSVAPTFRPSNDFDGRAYGAYVQDLVAVTPEWKVLGGIRYDRFKADMLTRAYTAAAPTTPSSTTESKLSYPSLWSYRTGVLWQPSATQSYHVSYGTSFNTSADTYQYTTQQIADVDAEKSRNIEVGAKLDWLEGALSTRLAIFRTEKYNERTTDSDFAGTFPVLSGKRHAQGVEFDVVGIVARGVEMYLSYSWIHKATIDKVGTAVAPGIVGSAVGLTPKHSGALWMSWQALPALRLAGGVRGASENRPLQGTTGAASTTARVPGYVAYDSMAEYAFTRDVYAQLNVTNLTDKLYGDQLYPGFYTPGEARSVKLTVGARF